MEELRRQLGERIPGAFELAAEGHGHDRGRIQQAGCRGQGAVEGFPAEIAAQLERTFGPQFEHAVQRGVAKIEKMKVEWQLTREAFAGDDWERAIGNLAEATGRLEALRPVATVLGDIASNIVNISA